MYLHEAKPGSTLSCSAGRVSRKREIKGSTLKGVCVWHSALGISFTARDPSGAPGMCLCGAAAAGRYGKQRSEENKRQQARSPQSVGVGEEMS